MQPAVIGTARQDVAGLQRGQKVSDGMVHDGGWDHQPHRPRLLQLLHEVRQRGGANGFLLGQHREAAGKNLPYEDAIRVPLLMRGPGIPGGGTVSTPVANVDLAPTILDAVGAGEPSRERRPVDGRSLLPLMTELHSELRGGRSAAAALAAAQQGLRDQGPRGLAAAAGFVCIGGVPGGR